MLQKLTDLFSKTTSYLILQKLISLCDVAKNRFSLDVFKQKYLLGNSLQSYQIGSKITLISGNVTSSSYENIKKIIYDNDYSDLNIYQFDSDGTYSLNYTKEDFHQPFGKKKCRRISAMLYHMFIFSFKVDKYENCKIGIRP